jgi:hypothetical protein
MCDKGKSVLEQKNFREGAALDSVAMELDTMEPNARFRDLVSRGSDGSETCFRASGGGHSASRATYARETEQQRSGAW